MPFSSLKVHTHYPVQNFRVLWMKAVAPYGYWKCIQFNTLTNSFKANTFWLSNSETSDTSCEVKWWKWVISSDWDPLCDNLWIVIITSKIRLKYYLNLVISCNICGAFRKHFKNTDILIHDAFKFNQNLNWTKSEVHCTDVTWTLCPCMYIHSVKFMISWTNRKV